MLVTSLYPPYCNATSSLDAFVGGLLFYISEYPYSMKMNMSIKYAILYMFTSIVNM